MLDTSRFSGIIMLSAGAAAVLAFAPFGWYPLAVVSLAILFRQWLFDSPGRAFRHGMLFGLGFFGAGMSWVYVSINFYGHVHFIPAVLVAMIFAGVLALFPALTGYALKRMLRQPTPATLVLAFPAAWVFSEWLRSWVFTGLPWLSIGGGQIDSPLAGFAPVSGILGVDLAVVLSAALLVLAFHYKDYLKGLLLLLLLWSGGAWLNSIEWTEARGEPLKVTIIQGNISQENKWAPENLLNTLTIYTEETFVNTDSDVIVWPETAIPEFYHKVEEHWLTSLDAELQKTGTDLITGIPMLDMTSWKYFNNVITVGSERGFYSKRHLVMFGEYLPLRWLIGSTLDALAVPNADFTAGGKEQTLLQAGGYPVGTSICFEVAFPEEIRRALPEAAYLVNVSNDAWFGRSLAPHQHLEMARMRAKETGRPMLRATNTGISAIIEPDGRIQARTGQFERASLSGRITPMQGATPYVSFGNWPVVLFVVICLVLGVLNQSRAKSQRR
jgi:apolipoprotein N-acyltransferase